VIPVEPNTHIKVWAKRTGGDATTTALVTAYLFD